MRQIRNGAAAFAALAALGMLAACSDDDPPARSEATPTGGPATSAAPEPEPEPDYVVLGETYLSGPGRWALPAVGDPRARLAVIDVPTDYQGRDGYVWLDVGGFGQVLYRAPTRVFVDPCDVERPSRRLGPTVEDLAEALVDQRRTTTTRPVPVMLGGYRGLYLELSTPGGRDVGECGPDGEMIIFEAAPGDGRTIDRPATERYWILDVEGRRVVVSAFAVKSADSSFVDGITEVAESVTFLEPAASAG